MTNIVSLYDIPDTILELAGTMACMRSKDPKTKVGACAYDWSTGATYFGYNGFPSGIPDEQSWWEEAGGAEFKKHELVVHAESAAMRKALVAGANMRDIELFVTHFPCLRCVVEHVIANKIKAVTARAVGPAIKDIQRVKQVLDYIGIPIFIR